MTAIHAGQEIHVTLEMVNGDVFSGQTMVATLSYTAGVYFCPYCGAKDGRPT